MTARLTVELYGRAVGELVDEGATAVFRWFASYWEDADRPLLGQWFEDGAPDEIYRGPGTLPAFFSNLEPEGGLARWLARKNQLGSGVLDLLGVAGDDLPGAVRLVPDDPVAWRARSVVFSPPRPTPSFSVAGVQMKLPMRLDREDRLTLPLAGELAPWLLKVPTGTRFGAISANEAATMGWAREAGFSVAECQLRELVAGILEGSDEARAEPCLLVRRYDRTADGRPVHQEDLAQAQWLDPAQKYPRARTEPVVFDAHSEGRRSKLASIEGVGRYARALLGVGGFEEYVRRVVFVMAVGNADAHLKNWSLLYADRRVPTWTPMYDQVSTIAWNLETLALPFYGIVNFSAVSRSLFHRLGAEHGCAASRIDEIVDTTLDRLRSAWPAADQSSPYPKAHRDRIRAHWRKVPLLKGLGSLV